MRPVNLALVVVAFVLGGLAAAYACAPAPVQGVIDFGQVQLVAGDKIERIHKIVEEKWNQACAADKLLDYRAVDRFVLTPPEMPDIRSRGSVDVQVADLAGGAATDATIHQIDWYEIWMWVDVSGDGKADAKDVLKGAPQKWSLIIHAANNLPAPNQLVNLIRGKVQLVSGGSYLFLIRVFAGGHSNLEFNGAVSFDKATKTFAIVNHAYAGAEQWTPDTQMDSQGIAATGAVPGVDPYEVLWLRVNNPPSSPRY